MEFFIFHAFSVCELSRPTFWSKQKQSIFVF